MLFVNKDLEGKVIDQPVKTGKSVEIDGNNRFCGHRFLLQGKMYGDKKCIYCAKWFHWKHSDEWKWIAARNIDDTNKDRNLEPLHCGSTHCDNYHQRYLRALARKQEEQSAAFERQGLKIFRDLKKRGIL